MLKEKSLVYLCLRLILGTIFIYHGVVKLLDIDSWMSYMNSKNINKFIAYFALFVEIIIGILLISGLFHIWTCLLGLCFMFVALYIAHRNDSIFGESGIGYQIIIILILIGLAISGFGDYNLKNILHV